MNKFLKNYSIELLFKFGIVKNVNEFKYIQSELVSREEYNGDLFKKDLYPKEKLIRVYWGEVQKKNKYYEIYLVTTIKANKNSVLTIIENGIKINQVEIKDSKYPVHKD